MRQIQVLVADDQQESVTEALDDEGFDYVRQRAWSNGEEQWLIEVPVPTDAVGYLLDVLDHVDVRDEEYMVIGSVETAMTPETEALKERFASDFDPLTEPELRSKAGDMSRDLRSFVALILLSAIIATAGLLADSPAVVVGSMVIAPIVGPVLTASVGATTGDRPMLFNSIFLQGTGLVVALLGSVAFSLALQYGGFVPESLDIASLDLIAVRISPGILSVVVGVAAGAAAAFGLATKGPTSVIGVMIAAALIPAAATVGIATAWGFPRIALGSLLLLVVTMILINLGALSVLLALRYRPDQSGWLTATASRSRQFVLIVSAIALVALLAVTAGAAFQQVAFEQQVNEEMETVLEGDDYDTLDIVSVRVQYGGYSPFGDPETVTVTLSSTSDGPPQEVASALEERIQAATDHEVEVRVEFVEYERGEPGARMGKFSTPPSPSYEVCLSNTC